MYMLRAGEEEAELGRHWKALKQQGVSPELVNQQMVMQAAGHAPQPEAAASKGRADAAPDDAALVRTALITMVAKKNKPKVIASRLHAA